MADAIDRFFRRFHRAVHANSKDIKMSLREANELAEEINRLLNRTQDTTSIEIVADGGRLSG